MKVKSRELSVCIFCENYVYADDKIFNMAFDRPIRINLITHKDCFRAKQDDGTLKQFIQDNFYSYLQKYMEIDLEEDNGKEKKGKKQPAKDTAD